MPTILLTFILLLNGNNSHGAHFDKAKCADSSQAAAVFLDPALEKVKATHEPTLRVFLRLKIAAYLWINPCGSKQSADEVVGAALVDLESHRSEIPPLYQDLFRRELTAQLKSHGLPVPRSSAEESGLNRLTNFDVAYSILKQDGAAGKAVSIVRSEIAVGKNPGSIIIFFLHKLEQVKPAEVPGVLDALISAEESRPGFITARSLFTLKHLYIREQTPKELQRRYLTALVNRAGETEVGADSIVDIYVTLTNVLQAVNEQVPKLYAIASARQAQLSVQVPSGVRERLAINKRVEQSADKVSQLLIEAEDTADHDLRDELLTRAAQLSLEKGRTREAIDLACKLQLTTSELRLWRDQFIEGAVEGALRNADLEAARYGAAHIEAVPGRSSALQKIALHLRAAGDLQGARDVLNSTLRLINAAGDGAGKATGLLELAVSYAKVDGQTSPQLVQAAVEAINKGAFEGRQGGHAGDGVENTMKLAYSITPAFAALGATDLGEALRLAKTLQREELELIAMVAVYTTRPATGEDRLGIALR